MKDIVIDLEHVNYISKAKDIKPFLKKIIIPYYQPIFSLKKGKIIGYEGLSRFIINGNICPFPIIYNYFKEEGLTKELDWFCRETLIREFPLGRDHILFVNILMSSVESDKFGKGLTRLFATNKGIEPSHVVLELVEAEKIQDIKKLIEVITYYRAQGFKISLDDFGTGYNTIEIFFEIASYIDYIKIPLKIVKGVSKSVIKYELLRTFKEISLNLGLEVIAEGIEHEEDLKTIVELGIDHGQGFLLSKPVKKDEVTKISSQIEIPKITYTGLLPTINNWLRSLPVMEVNHKCKFKDLLNYLKNIPQHEKYAAIEIEDGKLYLLNLWELGRLCADPIKFNLLVLRDINWLVEYGKTYRELIKSMEELEKNGQIIDIFDLTSIVELALKFQKSSFDVLLVKEHGKVAYYLQKQEIYERLYKEIYKSKIHINPLTGLPANVIIEDVIDSLISKNDDFFAGYLDIDNFKAFNDTYGFLKGDLMIKRTGFFLNRYIKETYEDRGFVGHIGGDDFVFVVEDNNEAKLRELLERIVDALEKNTRLLFSEKDIKQGFYIGKDRDGNMRSFPLSSFSVVVVRGKNKESVHQIAKIAAKLKKIAKRHRGSKILFESEIKGITTN